MNEDENFKNLLKNYASLTEQREALIEQIAPVVMFYYGYRHLYFSAEAETFVIAQFTEALSANEREILETVSTFKRSRGQSPEQKQLIKRAQNIMKKLKRWYNRLGNDIFPIDMVNSVSVVGGGGPACMVDDDEESVATETGVMKFEKKTPVKSKKPEVVEDPDEDDDFEGDEDDEEEVDDFDESSEYSPSEEKVSERTRRQLNRESVKNREQDDASVDVSPVTRRFSTRNAEIAGVRRNGAIFPDLYTTLEADVEVLIPFVELFKNKIVWDPCCGKKAFGDVFRANGFTTLIESDLVYGDTIKNFLTDEPFECDLIIANPPFSEKLAFLQRAYLIGKPFVFLLPLDTLGYMGTTALFQTYGVRVVVHRPFIRNFLKEGVTVKSVGACAYFFGNFPDIIANGQVMVEYFNREEEPDEEAEAKEEASA